jgi:hypothetical protein
MKSGIFLLVLLLIATTAHADSAVHIYECMVNGQHVFSDHVCGDNATERTVAAPNRMDAVKVHVTTPASHHSKRAYSSRTPTAQGTRRQRCTKIQKSRDALSDQMRTGFTARQDEKLHYRMRKLDSQYDELRCSGVQ